MRKCITALTSSIYPAFVAFPVLTSTSATTKHHKMRLNSVLGVSALAATGYAQMMPAMMGISYMGLTCVIVFSIRS